MSSRWAHQYQRIADVLTQRVEQLTELETPLTAYIRRLVDAAPPLTPEQRDRLSVLLQPAGES